MKIAFGSPGSVPIHFNLEVISNMDCYGYLPPDIQLGQGSKLTMVNSKIATWKSHLPPVKNVGSKKYLGILFWK